MRDIADANVALRGGDDFARLDAAATLDQLAVEACLLEVSQFVSDELRLIDRHRDGIDHAPGLVLGPCPARGDGGAASGYDRQRRTSGEMCHHARSFSLSFSSAATFSSAFSTASPISCVESRFASASAISAVRAPPDRALATAVSSRSASSGRL